MKSTVALLAGCFLLLGIFSDTVESTKHVPTIYEELDCTEVASDSGPKRFECPDIKSYSRDKCHLKGKTYNIGEDVGDDEVPRCKTACKCLKFGDNAPHIECANIECPEFFGRRDPTAVFLYDDLKRCCSSSRTNEQTRTTATKTCDVDGKKYFVGEPTHSANDPPRTRCICGEDGKPKCAKIDCGIQLKLADLQAGCVPVYFDTPNYCPVDYKCPAKDDAVEAGAESDANHTCKFGELTLKVGDSLKRKDQTVKCDCSTPPYVTCVVEANKV